MTRVLLRNLWLLGLLSACQREPEQAPANATPVGSFEAAKVTSVAPLPVAVPAPVRPMAPPAGLAGPSAHAWPPPSDGLGQPATPIALKPGRARSKVSGCAAQSKAAQAETPPVSKRSAGPLPKPQLSVTSGGIMVRHPFSHQCCLEAKTDTTVKGSEVAIVTTLTGMGCRCLCSSNIETTVGLEPGGYTVTVTLVTPSGGPREELREQVTVVKR